jgi:predicted nucleic acid-binding protein
VLRIYLDANVWSSPFDEQTQVRIRREAEAFFKILEATYQRHKCLIVGSLILDDEIEQIEEEWKRGSVKAIVDLFVSERIDRFSRSLQREIKALGLKDKDAIHLAFAINNSDYFITCDDKILHKKVEIEKRYSIKVVNPPEFVEEEL